MQPRIVSTGIMCVALLLAGLPDTTQAGESFLDILNNNLNKVKQQLQTQGQQQNAQAPHSGTMPDQAAQASSVPEQPSGQGVSAPWAPPADTPKAPAKIDPAKMPDIVGIHLGMSPAEANAALKKHHPEEKLDIGTYKLYLAANEKPVLYGLSFGYSSLRPTEERVSVTFTPPPTKQLVWLVERSLLRQKMARANVISSLREKYGKETVAYQGGSETKDDSQINEMWWILDEQGHPAKPPSGQAAYDMLRTCSSKFRNGVGASTFVPNNILPREPDVQEGGWCNSSGIIVRANVGGGEIVYQLDVDIVDMPLLVRAARAEIDWLKGIDQRRRQQELDESKKAKPSL